MCKKIKDAMPVGSIWTAYHSIGDKDMGYRKVTKHMSDRIQMDRGGAFTYLDMPKAADVELQPDGAVWIYTPHARNPDTGTYDMRKLMLVYTPVTDNA